jgi:hypothetical protein
VDAGDRQGAPPPVARGHVPAAPATLRPGGAPGIGGRPSGSVVAVGPGRRPVAPLPNLRRNVCPHFFITGSRGALPIQAPHLLKALIRQSSTVSRCQLRGGVHMAEDFVNDVCLSARFNQCVFYEDDLTGDT